MGWTAVVFDTDRSRAASLRDDILACDAAQDVRIMQAHDAAALRKAMESAKVDMLFCDVRACTSENGLEGIVQDVTARNTPAQIVLTGVSENNLVRLELLDHAFLLPTSPTSHDIQCALNRAIALRTKQLEQPLVVKSRGCSWAVSPNKVSFIESDLRKIRIHMVDDVIEAYGKLSGILRELPHRFVQCHKSFVVNLGFVVEFRRECLVLATGERVPVSQKRRRQTREAFDSYMGRTC